MRSNILNIILVNKIPVTIAILVPIVLVSTIYYFNDIETSIYVLIITLIIIAVMTLFILNPLWAYLLMILYMPYSEIIPVPIIGSGQRIFFIIVTIGWFLKYFMRGRTVLWDIIKFNRIILFFIFFMFLSSTLAIKPMPSFAMTFQIIFYIFMGFILQDLVDDKTKLRILITVLALNVGIVSLFGISEFLVSGATNEYGGINRVGSVYDHPNQFGKVLMFGIPFLAFLGFNARNFLLKVACLIMLLTSIFSLALSLSRAFMLAFIVFILAYLVLSLKNRLLSIKVIGAVLLIFIVFPFFIPDTIMDNITDRSSKNVTEEARYYILLKGIDVFLENPLFGIGFENFPYAYTFDKKYSDLVRRGRAGHEIVSNVLVSIGMFGSLTLIIVFYKIMHWLNKAAKNLIIQHDKYFINFTVLLQAGYIAFLSSAIATSVIFGIEFWIYYALAIKIYRLSIKNPLYGQYQSIK